MSGINPVRCRTRFAKAILVSALLLGGAARADDVPPERGTGSESQPPEANAPTADKTLTGNWVGYRKQFGDAGISIDLTLTLDGSKNLSGGIDTRGSAWRNLFEGTVTFDSKPLLGFEGGKLFIDFQNQSGQNGTAKLVGDVQKFDNVDADGRTEIAQLWCQQIFFDEKLRLKIGKVDANSEFQKSDYSGDFIVSSFAFSPTIFVLPTYPDGALSFNMFVRPGGGFYAGLGIYDGSFERGVLTGAQGPRRTFHDPQDLFLIAEVGKRWGGDTGSLPGRLGIGGWYDTNHFPRFDGGRDSGTGGSYFIFDQMLWRPAANGKEANADTCSISLFMLGGESDPHVSFMQFHLGGGIACNGPLPGRRDDTMGFGSTAVQFSREARTRSNNELAIDLFYKIQVTPWASLRPDLQYITTPGGQRRDALVATIRFLFNL